ncbi:MAG: MarR family transcriptional regulator [Verrucomicrobia bacterium]|nr:MAG: MarR family transcriptional regulator [Verrucomicrobiota bacterium]PYJ34241.1 MAG: MarR family transcriptional regulator [Verrucomicrobiota bacterium]
MKLRRPPRPTGAAFLLAQLGAHAADRFAERIEGLGVAPRHAGILRVVATTPVCNQRLLAKRLGVLPSRMVILLDELTEKGLLERKRSTKDRRHSEIILTRRGQRMLEKLSRLAAEHEADLCAALTAKEREDLAALGRKIVHQQGLTPDVHPGYRKL